MRPIDKSKPSKEIGVAWTVHHDNKEFFSISINPGVVINWRDCEDHWFSLSKKEQRHGEAQKDVEVG